MHAMHLSALRAGVFSPGGGNNKHCVMVYGWGVDQGTDYWLVQNSYGPTWRDQGRARVVRGANVLEGGWRGPSTIAQPCVADCVAGNVTTSASSTVQSAAKLGNADVLAITLACCLVLTLVMHNVLFAPPTLRAAPMYKNGPFLSQRHI